MNSKKILIISRKEDRTTHDTQETVLSQFANIDLKDGKYFGAYFEDILFTYDGTNLSVVDIVSGLPVDDFDLIFMIGWFKTKMLEDVASSISRFAKRKNIPCINTEALNSRVRSKLPQYVIAAINDISMTPFRFCMNQKALLKSLKTDPFNGQIIVKGVAASRGDDNYLISNAEEFEQILNNTSKGREIHFILQQYVPNDGDYRILVLGDKVRLVVHRQSQDSSHLNNTSKGGNAEIVELDTLSKDMLDDSIKLSSLVNREITGVDMIVDNKTGQHYLLEVNNMPQLSTGAVVPEKMHLLDEYFNEILNK